MIFFAFGALQPFLAEHPEVLRPGGKPQTHSGQKQPFRPAPVLHGPPAPGKAEHQRQQHIQPQLGQPDQIFQSLVPAFQVLRRSFLWVLPAFQHLEKLPETDRQPKSLCPQYTSKRWILQSILHRNIVKFHSLLRLIP